MAGGKGKDPNHGAHEEQSLPHQSSTEMIDRNRFLLHQLQGEIDRLKGELARQREDRESSASTEEGATPEEILREARAQLERLRRETEEGEEEKPPTPPPSEEGSRP